MGMLIVAEAHAPFTWPTDPVKAVVETTAPVVVVVRSVPPFASTT